MMRGKLKINYYGFLGLIGLLGFREPAYFLFFLFFLFFLATPKQGGESEPVSTAAAGGSATPELIRKQAEEKQMHKNKILELVTSQEKISNDNVQKLLGVSDATAERYLDELEKEGRVRQIGGQQKNTYYSKI